MGSGLFITGTDTGVGKTLVACGFAALFKSLGYRVGVMKPAETGCEEKDGKLFPRDASYLKETSGCGEALEKICPYRLRNPLAPSMAAEMEGIEIDISLLEKLYGEISSVHDITLVEGAGGLLVPLLPHYTYADLASLLKIPLIVVAANRLGAINHLLLTLEHASCRGLRVLGYVLNHVESRPSLAAETNAKALTLLTSIPCLGELPYLVNAPGDGTAMENRQAVFTALFQERINLTFLERAL